MPLPPLTFPDRPPLALAPTRVMGVLNVTPDSFSDGGRFVAPEAAAAHAVAMAREGAAVIDVGGESTRPGAQRVDAAAQVARVVPVVRAVRGALDEAGFDGVMLSVDTTRAAVAEAALDAGASMLNDVSAGREDENMFALAAARGVPIVLMHMLGEPGTMQDAPRYDDVVGEVTAFLEARAGAAEAAGVPASQVVIDPGIGFGKTVAHNLALLHALPRFVATGRAVLLGASRKRFISAVWPAAREPADRLPGTLAVTAWAASAGVSLVRVHDVAANAQAAAVAGRVMVGG